MARADYLALIGEKVCTSVTEESCHHSSLFSLLLRCIPTPQDLAIKAYEETLEKTVGSGGRIDVELAVLRLGLCWHDMDLLKNHLVKAKE